jgi:hypothetical protein
MTLVIITPFDNFGKVVLTPQNTIYSDCDYTVENIRCWNCKANYSYFVSVGMSYNICFTTISKFNWRDAWSLKQYQLSPTWVFCRLIQEAGEIFLKFRMLSMGGMWGKDIDKTLTNINIFHHKDVLIYTCRHYN